MTPELETTPEPPDHIGTVEKVEGSLITVIEGNYSNAVKRRVLEVNGRYIRGYICPKYDGAGSSSGSTSSGSAGSSSGSSSGGLNKTEKWSGTVTASSLNVRTWAGEENAPCSFSPLKNGTKVSVCDSIKDSDGDAWYYIKYNGKYGFVHSRLYLKERFRKHIQRISRKLLRETVLQGRNHLYFSSGRSESPDRRRDKLCGEVLQPADNQCEAERIFQRMPEKRHQSYLPESENSGE